MADLNTVRVALAAVLNGVGPPGQAIRASADVQSTVNPPCAIITLPPGTSLQWQALGQPPSGQYNLRVTILCNIGENVAADQLLSTYLSTSGDGSLLAALAADPTLGGACDWCIVQSVHGFGWIEWGGIPYLGAQMALQVGISG